MSTQHTYRGTLHGSSVQLETTPNLPNGLEVVVTIHQIPLTDDQRRNRLESLFGSCADEAESLDEFMEWNGLQRKHNRNGSQQ